MDQCVCEQDYLDYVESRISPIRLIRLRVHAVTCPRCRQDLASWPSLRRLVLRAERQGAGCKVGLADEVMARIRCAESHP